MEPIEVLATVIALAMFGSPLVIAVLMAMAGLLSREEEREQMELLGEEIRVDEISADKLDATEIGAGGCPMGNDEGVAIALEQVRRGVAGRYEAGVLAEALRQAQDRLAELEDEVAEWQLQATLTEVERERLDAILRTRAWVEARLRRVEANTRVFGPPTFAELDQEGE